MTRTTALGVALVSLLAATPAFAAGVHYATNPVPESWIVEVKASVGVGAPMAALAQSLATAHGGQVGFMYDGRLRGFVLRVPDRAITGLAQHPLIKNLVQDERYQGVLSEAAPRCYPPARDAAPAQYSPPSRHYGRDGADARVYAARGR